MRNLLDNLMKLENALNIITFESKNFQESFTQMKLEPKKALVNLIKEYAKTEEIKVSKLWPDLIDNFFNQIIESKDMIIHKADTFLLSWFNYYLFSAVVREPFKDVMAEILWDLNELDKKSLGQCFTPKDIASLIGEIGKFYFKTDSGSLAINDPCCGSGALILSQLEHVNHDRLEISMNDIDPDIYRVGFIQVYLNAAIHKTNTTISLNAECGNALLGSAKESVTITLKPLINNGETVV
jgi:type I restriction-modification system DNA methylase subunit